MQKGVSHCYACEADCRKGLLSKIKPYGFTLFVKRYGEDVLLDCLERNEKNGVVYHREGIVGDYDDFSDVEALIAFIQTGKRSHSHGHTLYHASQTPGIKTLEPRVSNDKVPRIYFSEKRENTLVYLSNAVEKTCREDGFAHTGKWQKWASYGFTKDGLLHYAEYYENALEDTYKDVSGYIYAVKECDEMQRFTNIPGAYFSERPLPVVSCEFVPDALIALLEAEREGRIVITRYAELSDKMRDWIKRTTFDEYRNNESAPDYRYFLKKKFPFLSEE